MGQSFTIAAGPRQRSHSEFRVPWDSLLCFTVSDSWLLFSSPPTTCRATVEVFDPASTRDISLAQVKVKSKSKSHCGWRVSQSVNLSVEPHLGPMITYLLPFENYGLVFVGCPLWREDGSVVHAAGSCQRSLSRVRIPWDSRSYFTVSDLRFNFFVSADPHYITSARTAQKKCLPKVSPLLRVTQPLPSNGSFSGSTQTVYHRTPEQHKVIWLRDVTLISLRFLPHVFVFVRKRNEVSEFAIGRKAKPRV
jgi:hypothetical protein